MARHVDRLRLYCEYHVYKLFSLRDYVCIFRRYVSDAPFINLKGQTKAYVRQHDIIKSLG